MLRVDREIKADPRIAIGMSGRGGKDEHPHGMCVIEVLRETLDPHPEGERWHRAYRS